MTLPSLLLLSSGVVVFGAVLFSLALITKFPPMFKLEEDWVVVEEEDLDSVFSTIALPPDRVLVALSIALLNAPKVAILATAPRVLAAMLTGLMLLLLCSSQC